MGLFDGLSSIGNMFSGGLDSLLGSGNLTKNMGNMFDSPAGNAPLMKDALNGAGFANAANTGNLFTNWKDTLLGGKNNIGLLTGGASIFKDLGTAYAGIEGIKTAKKQMALQRAAANAANQRETERRNHRMMDNFLSTPSLQQANPGMTAEEYVARYGEDFNRI